MPTKKYKVEGKRVPGVTTVIKTSLGWGKEGLLHWAWEQGMEGLDFREEREKAAGAGTIAHAMCEADIKGWPLPLLPFEADAQERENWLKAETAFRAYRDWVELSKLRLIVSEASFVSPKVRCGGTIDAVADFDGRTELIDFKTSKGLYPDHLIQVAAYRELWEHGEPFETELTEGRSPIHGVHILRFSKEGDFHHHHWPVARMEKPWRAFELLRELYDLKKAIEGMV